MLSAVMLNFTILSVFMFGVVVLNVVAPENELPQASMTVIN
jgi:hypothetical protein